MTTLTLDELSRDELVAIAVSNRCESLGLSVTQTRVALGIARTWLLSGYSSAWAISCGVSFANAVRPRNLLGAS